MVRVREQEKTRGLLNFPFACALLFPFFLSEENTYALTSNFIPVVLGKKVWYTIRRFAKIGGIKMAKSGLKGLDWIVKIILVIIYDIYGILRRLTSGSIVGILVGIIQIFTANLFGILWLVDLITVLLKKEVTVLA